MDLFVGGKAQGKLNYVLNKYDLSFNQVLDGENINNISEIENYKVFNHFNIWVKNMLLNSRDVYNEIELILKINPEIIIISDDLGNGIVPIDKFERNYREFLGRVLCTIAQKSVNMERIICGIGQKIK